MSSAMAVAPSAHNTTHNDRTPAEFIRLATTGEPFHHCQADPIMDADAINHAANMLPWVDNARTLRSVMDANPRIRDHLAWWATQLRISSPPANNDEYFTVCDDHHGESEARYITGFDGILFCWYIRTTDDLTSIDIPSEDDYELSKSDHERLNSIADSLERSKALLALTNRRMLADCFWLSPMNKDSRYSGARCKNAMYVSPQDNHIHVSTAARGTNLTSDDTFNVLSGRIVRQDMPWNLGNEPKMNQINLYLPLQAFLAIM